MNNYISKYSKFETHFERTDPFKYATGGEGNEKENKMLIISSVLGLALTLVTLMWFA